MPKRVEIGIVTSDKAAKTRRVEIPRLVRHPRYGKYVRRKTVCHVHDENNESHLGDLVEIVESRPLSQTEALGVGAGGDEGPAGRHGRDAGRGQRSRPGRANVPPANGRPAARPWHDLRRFELPGEQP